MRNPNFLVLDEPTNDFDIVTLNVVEEYLANFGGCLIIVSHDRFFMDKLVEHLFIFEGNGAVYDFPGNYSDYRVSQKQQEIENRRSEEQPRTKTAGNAIKEVDEPERRNAALRRKRNSNSSLLKLKPLEEEKKMLEASLSHGNLETNDLIAKSHRIAEIINLIDQKTDRWLELSE